MDQKNPRQKHKLQRQINASVCQPRLCKFPEHWLNYQREIMDLRFAHTIQVTYSPRFIISERIRYGCYGTPYNTVTLPTIQEAKSVYNSNHKLSQDPWL